MFKHFAALNTKSNFLNEIQLWLNRLSQQPLKNMQLRLLLTTMMILKQFISVNELEKALRYIIHKLKQHNKRPVKEPVVSTAAPIVKSTPVDLTSFENDIRSLMH